MSYCFRVESVGVPTYEGVLGALGGADVRCQTGVSLAGPWRVGHAHRLFIHGVSTRSVEAVYEGRGFLVRLFSGASPEDYELALEIVGAVARAAGRPIVSEEGVQFRPEERRRGYGRGWIDDHIRTIAKVILRMAASKRVEDPVVIDGPMRPFYCGPRVATAIIEQGHTDLDRAERLIEAMRRLQYFRVPVAPSEVVRLPDSEQLVSCVRLVPGQEAVLERVDVVAVASSAPAHVPWSNVDALLGPYARWLDEWTVHVPAISPAVWDEVVARAEQLEAPPGDAPSHLTQNTWWSTQVTDAPTEVFPPPKPREAQTPEDPGVRRWWDIWRERR